MATCYIDAKDSKCPAKYTNHSFRNNAVFSKMTVIGKEKPYLVIKASKNILKGEETFTHYGDEFERILRYVSGCKCIKCIDKNKSVVTHNNYSYMIK